MRQNTYKVFFLLFFFSAVQNIFPENSTPLKKHIIINNNYDINIIKNIVKDYCVRWNMVDNSQTKLYQNQILLYFSRLDNTYYIDNNIFQYVAVYISDNTINIIIQDYLTLRSKWFDNFPIDLLNEFLKNNIVYSEVINN
jgi:hypothetical protein